MAEPHLHKEQDITSSRLAGIDADPSVHRFISPVACGLAPVPNDMDESSPCSTEPNINEDERAMINK